MGQSVIVNHAKNNRKYCSKKDSYDNKPISLLFNVIATDNNGVIIYFENCKNNSSLIMFVWTNKKTLGFFILPWCSVYANIVSISIFFFTSDWWYLNRNYSSNGWTQWQDDRSTRLIRSRLGWMWLFIYIEIEKINVAWI